MKLSNEVKVGILTLISIALFVIGYNFLKGKNIFDSRNMYFAEYDKVDGLLVANPVFVNGYQVGIVEDIIYLPATGRLKVALMINDEVEVPANAEAVIVANGLMGDMKVNLVVNPEGGRQGEAAYGGMIKGRMEVGMVDAVTDQLVPTKDKVDVLLVKVDSLITTFNKALDAEKLNKIIDNLDVTVASFNKISTNLEKATNGLDSFMTTEKVKISAILDNANSIASNLQQNNAKITSVLDNANKMTGDLANADLDGTIKSLSSTVNTANDALGQLNTTLSKINNGDGTLGLLLKDEGLYNNLESTAANLDLLMIDLRKNPLKYVQFSLIGGGKKKRKNAEE